VRVLIRRELNEWVILTLNSTGSIKDLWSCRFEIGMRGERWWRMGEAVASELKVLPLAFHNSKAMEFYNELL